MNQWQMNQLNRAVLNEIPQAANRVVGGVLRYRGAALRTVGAEFFDKRASRRTHIYDACLSSHVILWPVVRSVFQ